MTKQQYLGIAIGGVMTVFFVIFDLTQPLGVAGGIPYVFPVITGFFLKERLLILLFGCLGIILTIVGFYASPSGSDLAIVLMNRGLAIFFLIAVTVTGYIIVSRQITLEKKFVLLANNDSLTGLYNRRFIVSKTINIIKENRFSKGFAVVFVDLDGFKLLNDSYGHRLGDELLYQVGKRLKEFSNQAKWVARLGGDEFVLIIDSNNHATLLELAKAVSKAISHPFHLYESSYEISCSIGISCWPSDAKEATLLLQTADIAMYSDKKAKSNKGGTFYNKSMLTTNQRQLEVEQALRHAIDKNELYLMLQPQFSAEPSQALLGAEVLLRWNSDKLGFVSPGEFIPIAEKSGMMPVIGKWVLKKSCALIADWKNRYPEVLRLSINLSSKELDINFCERLTYELVSFNLPPEVLMLEVTETEMANFNPELIQKLDLLRKQGLKISIDDFGTGYSSLAYLSQVSFDEIKIDRSFIMNLPDDQKSLSLVNTIVSMAKILKCQVVAEGVENVEQLVCLRELGVEIIQGFLLGKPMLTNEFEKYLSV